MKVFANVLHFIFPRSLLCNQIYFHNQIRCSLLTVWVKGTYILASLIFLSIADRRAFKNFTALEVNTVVH